MTVPVRRKLRIQFLKWHRAFGVFAAVFVLLLVASGIVLNHSHDLELDARAIPASMLSFYGINIKKPEKGFAVSQIWVVELENQLFVNGNLVGQCVAPLIGAGELSDGVLSICQDSVYLTTFDGQVVEMTRDVPEAVVAMQIEGAIALVKGVNGRWRFDADTFEWQREEQAIQVQWLVASMLPDQIAQHIAMRLQITEITWERFILDLHSGRLFGEKGVWFVDFVAVVLGLLAISGVWLRFSRLGRPKR